MVEWHIPFDHILTHWTDEQLDVMVEKLLARKKRESGSPAANTDAGKVPDAALFQQAKNIVKWVKH